MPDDASSSTSGTKCAKSVTDTSNVLMNNGIGINNSKMETGNKSNSSTTTTSPGSSFNTSTVNIETNVNNNTSQSNTDYVGMEESEMKNCEIEAENNEVNVENEMSLETSDKSEELKIEIDTVDLKHKISENKEPPVVTQAISQIHSQTSVDQGNARMTAKNGHVNGIKYGSMEISMDSQNITKMNAQVNAHSKTQVSTQEVVNTKIVSHEVQTNAVQTDIVQTNKVQNKFESTCNHQVPTTQSNMLTNDPIFNGLPALGANLANRNLSNLMNNSTRPSSNLSNSNLQNSNLQNSNLQNSSLQNSNLQNPNLPNSNLANSNLSSTLPSASHNLTNSNVLPQNTHLPHSSISQARNLNTNLQIQHSMQQAIASAKQNSSILPTSSIPTSLASVQSMSQISAGMGVPTTVNRDSDEIRTHYDFD